MQAGVLFTYDHRSSVVLDSTCSSTDARLHATSVLVPNMHCDWSGCAQLNRM